MLLILDAERSAREGDQVVEVAGVAGAGPGEVPSFGAHPVLGAVEPPQLGSHLEHR